MSSKKTTIKTEAPSEWTKEQTNMLLNRMLANLTKNDTQKYTTMLEKLNWDKVVFGGLTVSECKEKWNLVSREVRKYRTLTELVTDAKEYLRDPYKGQIKKHPDYPKRPLTPYFKFFMEKRDGYATKHKDMTNLQVTAELSKKYRALTTKKKDKYVADWKAETIQFQLAMKKFKEEHPEYFEARPSKPADPRTPGTIYKDETYEEYARKHPKLSKKECLDQIRKRYKSLSDEKRQKFIEKALKEQQEQKLSEKVKSENDVILSESTKMRLKPERATERQKHQELLHLFCQLKKKANAIEKFVVSNPDIVKKERVILNKYEQKLNDKKMGKPEKPPSNGYNLFCTEMMPQLKNMLSQKRIVECGRLWNLKSSTDKQVYHDRYLKLKEQFEEDMETYTSKLTPEERLKEQSAAVKQKKKTIKIKQEVPEETSDEDDEDDTDENLPPGGDTSEEEDEESEEEDGEDEDDKDTDVENNNIEEEEAEEEDENLPKLPAPARPTTPISALFLYQKANRKKIEGQYPTMSSDEITRLLARRYHELPEHKKHKYLQKEKEQRAIYNEKMQEFLKESTKKNGVETPKPTQLQAVTGEQLYHEKHTALYNKKYNNNKEKVEAALRVAWSKLSKVRKEPFIKSAHQRNEKNIAAFNQAMQKHKSEKSNSSNSNKNKSAAGNQSAASSTIKIKLAGEPKRPPSSGYQLFSSTHMSKLSHLSQNEKFREMGRLWQNLDDSRKKSFSDEAKKQTERFKKELEMWLKSLPKSVAEQYREAKKPKKRLKKSADAPPSKKAKIDDEAPDQNNIPGKDSDSSDEDSEDSDSSTSDESDDGESGDSDSSESESDDDSSGNSSSDDDDSSSSNSE